MKDSRIVLLTDKNYSANHQHLLESFLRNGCELFCVLGQYSENWEEAMDWLVVSSDNNNSTVITTSHVNEDLNDVLNMAQHISLNTESRVKIVRV